MACFAAAAARGGGAAPGASVSGDVAPWLAAGCLSPRRLLAEVRAALGDGAGGAAVGAEGGDAACGSSSGGGGLRWVEFELLWRDFLRLLTQRQAQIVLPRVRAAVAEAVC
jgi:deoxyribodipyrimidine photolyase